MTAPDPPAGDEQRPTPTAKEDATPPEQALPGATEPAPDAPVKDVPAESVPAEQKLDDPGATGKMATDPAASVEKTEEAAAPAPEGAQPAQPTQPAAEQAKPAAERPARPAGERPARPAREAEPKGPARNPPPPGSLNEQLAAAAPGVPIKAAYMVPAMQGEAVCVEVAPADVPGLLTACRDDERLDLKYLRSLSGVDWQEDGLEVVYHLASLNKKHELTVKTRVTVDEPAVPSVAAIYPAADWHEREARDMFGIDFPGHPNLAPLLLPEDMTDHFPLRKDNPLQEIEEWQGENLREGAGEDEE